MTLVKRLNLRELIRTYARKRPVISCFHHCPCLRRDIIVQVRNKFIRITITVLTNAKKRVDAPRQHPNEHNKNQAATRHVAQRNYKGRSNNPYSISRWLFIGFASSRVVRHTERPYVQSRNKSGAIKEDGIGWTSARNNRKFAPCCRM